MDSDYKGKPLPANEAHMTLEKLRDESVGEQWALIFTMILLFVLGAVLCILIWINATNQYPAAQIYVTVAGGLMILLAIGVLFHYFRNTKRIHHLKDLAATY